MSKRLGNAIDPFETLEKYGPDATRWYMISNANPWDNLRFDLTGIDEVKRKFFGTLYNTYSFLLYMPTLIILIFPKRLFLMMKNLSLTDGLSLSLIH